ncbi:Uncharacterized protein HZ326_27883 [Fusarium oxysporum f. sp. albedinis]|nr:Uncharacterized protein HZ326_27883 [Fusarium oxysporum f. sp. albedinis]
MEIDSDLHGLSCSEFFLSRHNCWSISDRPTLCGVELVLYLKGMMQTPDILLKREAAGSQVPQLAVEMDMSQIYPCLQGQDGRQHGKFQKCIVILITRVCWLPISRTTGPRIQNVREKEVQPRMRMKQAEVS